MLKLLESLYSSTKTSLQESPDDTFELTVGVRQGGPESPLLYNLYMDFVMRIYVEQCRQQLLKQLQILLQLQQELQQLQILKHRQQELQ